MSVDVEEVNYIFMVCLYLKLKKHFLAIFGYSFWKCVAKLATVSKILARAQRYLYVKTRKKYCYFEVFVIRKYCVFNDTDKSGRKCILTAYVIIDQDSEAFRTSSPSGEPLTFISI